MATTPTWTITLMEDAAEKFQFIDVTPNIDNPSPRVSIVDAQRLWRQNPQILFQTGYRIAGTAEDIQQALTAAGIEANQIEEVINSSISSENYMSEDTFQIFSDEVTNYNLWKRGAVRANVEAPGVKLFDVMTMANPALLDKVRTQKKATAMGLTTFTAPKGAGRSIKPLEEKLGSVPAGKILDVSNMTETGAKTVLIPIPSDRSKKRYVPSLPMASSDIEHYLMAIRMLPGGEAQYATQIAQMRQLLGGSVGAPGAIRPAAQPLPSQPFPSQPYVSKLAGLEAFTAPPPKPGMTHLPVQPVFTATDRRKRAAAQKSIIGLPVPLPSNSPTPGLPVPLPSNSPAPGLPVPLPSGKLNTGSPSAGLPTTIPAPLPYEADDSDDEPQTEDDDDSDDDSDYDSDDDFNPVSSEFPGTIPGSTPPPAPAPLPSFPAIPRPTGSPAFIPASTSTSSLPAPTFSTPSIPLPSLSTIPPLPNPTSSALPTLPLPPLSTSPSTIPLPSTTASLPTLPLPSTSSLPPLPAPSASPLVRSPGMLPSIPPVSTRSPGALPTLPVRSPGSLPPLPTSPGIRPPTVQLLPSPPQL